jgi:opacity protein-like surface antigen
VSVLPGYKFGPNTLGFVRVGAAQAKLKAEGGPSQTHNGIVFGIGVKQAVSPNLALSLEYQNYDLEEKDDLTPRSTGVVLGVQFTFR